MCGYGKSFLVFLFTITECPLGANTTPMSASKFASTCFGTSLAGKPDPETTTKHNCKCKDQCRADATRNFAEDDWCQTEGGFFRQCGEGSWPRKYDWCRYSNDIIYNSFQNYLSENSKSIYYRYIITIGTRRLPSVTAYYKLGKQRKMQYGQP